MFRVMKVTWVTYISFMDNLRTLRVSCEYSKVKYLQVNNIMLENLP